MANELIRVYGTPKTLASSGGSITNNSIVQATTASYVTATDGNNYPHARFTLSFTFGTAPTEATSLVLVARLKNIVTTNHAQVPEVNRPDRTIGSFIVDNVTTTQYASLFAYDVPDDADYYLINQATGQTVSSGWSLVVIPMTYKPA